MEAAQLLQINEMVELISFLKEFKGINLEDKSYKAEFPRINSSQLTWEQIIIDTDKEPVASRVWRELCEKSINRHSPVVQQLTDNWNIWNRLTDSILIVHHVSALKLPSSTPRMCRHNTLKQV